MTHHSFPKIEGWGRDLGAFLDRLREKGVAVPPDLCGSAVVRPEVADLVRESTELLAKLVGLNVANEIDVNIPEVGVERAVGNLAGLAA